MIHEWSSVQTTGGNLNQTNFIFWTTDLLTNKRATISRNLEKFFLYFQIVTRGKPIVGKTSAKHRQTRLIGLFFHNRPSADCLSLSEWSAVLTKNIEISKLQCENTVPKRKHYVFCSPCSKYHCNGERCFPRYPESLFLSLLKIWAGNFEGK